MPTSPVRRIAFIGNHTPRRCGLATFTADLAQALTEQGAEVGVVAMNDRNGPYVYPSRVVNQIDQDDPASYVRAAAYLERSGYEVACLQHEYGIFGGEAGAHVLQLLRHLKMPLITTLHTILNDPNPAQRQVMDEILQLSERVVVMSERGRRILTETYSVDPEKIDLIPHGAPDVDIGPTEPFKRRLGVGGKEMILTFGLLSPDKGIEYMIEAMPSIVARRPNALYVVLGATHPNIRKAYGETYRDVLTERAARLGVADHVRFIDKYVSDKDLIEFLQGADVYVTPYLKKEQVTSGTLAYAIGCGKAVVSTPYWHAEELLVEGRGMLVPFRDPDSLAYAVCRLLEDRGLRTSVTRKAAELGASMRWSEGAKRYIRCFAQAKSESLRRLRRIVEGPETAQVALPQIPEFNLNHIREMSEVTGILQHASYCLPNRAEGFCTDDNARALILMLRLLEQGQKVEEATVLGRNNLAFLRSAFEPRSGRFRNMLDYDRRWTERVGSEDSHGRAIWALGHASSAQGAPHWASAAPTLFQAALPASLKLRSLRAWAFVILGIDAYLDAFGNDDNSANVAIELCMRLHSKYVTVAGPNWRWFENIVAYDNARLPHALLLAGIRFHEDAWVDAALDSLGWLMRVQTGPNDLFAPVGSNGFFPRGGPKAEYDQQPLEAWASVEACLDAANATGESRWREDAHRAFGWFLGSNTEGLPLYDPTTGGCRDGLHHGRTNLNEGAESTLAFHLAATSLRVEGVPTEVRDQSRFFA